MVTDILSSMLFSYRGNTEAADLPLVTNKSKGQGEFIALWRRLLASATGISSNVIHNTKDTLTSPQSAPENEPIDQLVKFTTSCSLAKVIAKSVIAEQI